MELPTQSTQVENQPTITPTETPYREKPKSKFTSLLLGTIVVLLGAIYGVLVSQLPKSNTTTAILPTPTELAIPTTATNQSLSSLASGSAFLNLQQSIASLSSDISSFTANDSSLNPPTLDVSLGLDSK